MGKATPIWAPTPGLWNCIPNPGKNNMACGGFLSRRQHPVPARSGFWWTATPCGTAADCNSAGWTPKALRFLDEKADFRTWSCRSSKKTALETSGYERAMQVLLNGPQVRPNSRDQNCPF